MPTLPPDRDNLDKNLDKFAQMIDQIRSKAVWDKDRFQGTAVTWNEPDAQGNTFRAPAHDADEMIVPWNGTIVHNPLRNPAVLHPPKPVTGSWLPPSGTLTNPFHLPIEPSPPSIAQDIPIVVCQDINPALIDELEQKVIAREETISMLMDVVRAREVEIAQLKLDLRKAKRR